MSRTYRFSRVVLEHFALHARLGYVSGLLLLLAPFGALGAIDLYRYDNMGLHLPDAIGVAIVNFRIEQLLEWASAMVLFLVILPGALAISRVLPWSDRPFPRAFSSRARWVAYVYIPGAATVASFVLLTGPMEVISGAEKHLGGFEYAFQSWLRPAVLLGFVPLGLKAVSMLILLALPAVLELLFKGAEETESPDRNRFQEYLVRAKLADLGSDYYPHHGRHVLNFNAGSLAPCIQVIRRREIQLHNGYQERVPGSRASRDYLLSLWRDAYPKLGAMLGEPAVLDSGRVALFESTTRALEAVITGFPGRSHLIVSPLEHPSESVLALELEKKGIASAEIVPPTATLFQMSGGDLESAVAREFVKRLQPDATNIVLLSEVCWSTGSIVDVRWVFNAIHNSWSEIKGSGSLKTVVDGAHAVGNSTYPQVDAGSAYVFSGHKWVLAPNPCGLAVVFDQECEFFTYDSWNSRLPESTCDASTICGLSAALELGPEFRRTVLIPRARDLKATFLRLIGADFQVVGNENGDSLLVAILPRERLRWRETWSAVIDALEASELSALPIEVNRDDEGKEYWLRLTFPYFLDHRDLIRASNILKSFARRRVG